MKRFEERKKDLYDEEVSREIYDDIKEKYILEIEKIVKKLNNIEI